MSHWNKQDVCALCLAAVMLLTGALYPARPSAAWWGTAFAITSEQSVDEPQNKEQTIVFRWRIAEWWQSLAG